MTEKFHELYQEISEVKTVLDYDLMQASLASHLEEGEITAKDYTVLCKCLDAFAHAMEII